MLCAACGSQKMKTLRAGVTRVREELEALAGVAVGEVTGDTDSDELPDAPVLVGTEAVLHRVTGPVRAVAFLEFDQELLAPRYRAGEEALGLLAAGGMTALYLGGGLWAVMRMKAQAHAAPKPFEATLAELGRDLEAFKGNHDG
jgi:primosomal protein N' (replication factor Y)